MLGTIPLKDANRFWDVMSRWWSIPAFLYVASLIGYSVMSGNTQPDVLVYALLLIAFMPAGILHYVGLLNIDTAIPAAIAGHALWISGYAWILWNRYKMDRVLRWAILAIIAFFLLGIGGCEASTGADFGF